MIKAIVFDFGGTIFDYSPSNYELLGKLARRFGRNLLDQSPLLSQAFQKQEEVMIEIFKAKKIPFSDWNTQYLTKEDWEKCDEILLKTIDIDHPEAISNLIDNFNERMFKFQIYPETIETIRKLKKEGYILGIISNLSNISKIKDRYLQLKEFNLHSLFDSIIFSGEYPYAKPNSQIFLSFSAQCPKIKPDEIMYVGDSYAFDILGAKNVGWYPVLLDRNAGTTWKCTSITNFSEIFSLLV